MTNDLGIHAPLPSRKDFRIGILGSGFIVSECRLVAYRKAGFNPVAIASRTRPKAEAAAQHWPFLSAAKRPNPNSRG